MVNIEYKYKVLWVEDNHEIVNNTRIAAKLYEIDLIHFDNWEDAEVELERHYNDYSAIILDGRCRVGNGNDEVDTEWFLTAIMPQLKQLYGEKHWDIPWYIYTAGAEVIREFDGMMESIGYKRNQEDWGDMVFLKVTTDKNKNLDCLLQTIVRVASRQDYNIVKQRYKEVFQWLGKGKLIDDEDAYETMLKCLCALYFPEKNYYYEYEANPLRRVLESILHKVNELGIIPNECMNGSDMIANPCKYMSGEVVNGYRYRFGNMFGDENLKYVVMNLRKTMSKLCHHQDGKYIIKEDKKELFWGFVMHLCGLIRWCGNFVKDPKNIEKAKNNIEQVDETEGNKEVKVVSSEGGKLERPQESRGRRAICKVVEKDGAIVGEACYKMSYSAKDYIGKMIEIKKLEENSRPDKDSYPLFIVKYDVLK